MAMLKDTVLHLAQQHRVKEFVSTNTATRRVVRRFVAGETLAEALDVTRKLNARHISATLDHLGENVSDSTEASSAARVYRDILDRIAEARLDASISIKLTALGLDVDRDLCRANLESVLQAAAERDIFVRVDMEGSSYTQATIAIVQEMRAQYDVVGTVIQSMLYRSEKDVEELIATKTRVRLVKGAYLEPPPVAYQRKADVDAQFVKLAHALLDRGNYPAIATHDQEIIEDVRRYAADHDIPRSRFEFQMLYGIRRDLQERLAREGYNVRIYVPYGTQWYPYLTRRMAERPANLVFVLSNAFRG